MERFNRSVYGKVIKSLNVKRLVFIIGPRRVGKTTLMKIIFDGFDVKKSFFIDVETLSEFSMFENYRKFIRYLGVNGIAPEDKTLIGIDEAQHIRNINSILKSVIDHNRNWHILCSGSSSLGILKNVRESLAGRKRVIHLSSLYFNEYLNFSKEQKLIEKLREVKSQKEWNWIKDDVISVWEEYLIYGGMPEVTLNNDIDEKKNELNDISRSYILLDIYDYLRGKVEIMRYNKLIQLIANNSGRLLNISNLAQNSGMKRDKVEEIIFLLESSDIIKQLPPFFTNKNKEITKAKKIIFYDTGIRNAIINDFRSLNLRTDNHQLLEIAIANNLRNCDIFYYRTKHQTEIDFIIKRDKELIPIEVKGGNTKSIPRAIKFFIKKYKIKEGYVLTKDIWKRENFENRIVHFIPAPLFAFSLPWE